jgi:hypothetical protein
MIEFTIFALILAVTVLITWLIVFYNQYKRDKQKQDHDIQNLMVAHMMLVTALKDAAEAEQLIRKFNYGQQPKAEA